MDKELKISKDFFEKLCALQCDIKEICGAFNCSEEQIRNWCKKTYNADFNDVYRVKSTRGKINLRNLQFKLAEKSPTMAIYLGKVYLNQDDGSKNKN
ncbi:MAG: hypothetical protein IJ068_06685 [Bacilli bacterium]|nr:hypothetical protein [Bacilli bacterium]